MPNAMNLSKKLKNLQKGSSKKTNVQMGGLTSTEFRYFRNQMHIAIKKDVGSLLISSNFRNNSELQIPFVEEQKKLSFIVGMLRQSDDFYKLALDWYRRIPSNILEAAGMRSGSTWEELLPKTSELASHMLY